MGQSPWVLVLMLQRRSWPGWDVEHLAQVGQVFSSSHMFLPGASDSLATGWPLQRVILMTICSGSWPRSLVRLVPMPKPVGTAMAKALEQLMMRGTVSASLKISVLVSGSTRWLR